MACKHEFIGTDKGVDCILCGLHLTTEQFRDFLAGKPINEAPKKTRKKKSDA